jgi:hypothetical protein
MPCLGMNLHESHLCACRCFSCIAPPPVWVQGEWLYPIRNGRAWGEAPPLQAVARGEAHASADDLFLRDEGSFEAGNLQRHVDYWESHILRDHPDREELLAYLKGSVTRVCWHPSGKQAR